MSAADPEVAAAIEMGIGVALGAASGSVVIISPSGWWSIWMAGIIATIPANPTVLAVLLALRR